MAEASQDADKVEVRHKALQQELQELVDVVGPGPLVDLLLERAFEVGATDIHLDPVSDGLKIRLRVDGLLHDVLRCNSTIAPQIVSRIKLLAGMDITERRVMQDGHFANAAIRHQRDVRVGGGPTIHGERLVLRLMPDSTVFTSLGDLGFEESQQRAIDDALALRTEWCCPSGQSAAERARRRMPASTCSMIRCAAW